MPFVSSILTLLAMIYVIMRIDWMLAVVAVAAIPLLYLTTRSSVGRLRESWKQRAGARELRAVGAPGSAGLNSRRQGVRPRRPRGASGSSTRSRARLAELMRVDLLQMKFDLTIALLIADYQRRRPCRSASCTSGPARSRLGNLLLVIGYLAQLYAPLRTMSRKSSQLQSSLAGAERALAVLDEVPDVAERPTARPLVRASGEIEFRNVSFGYGDDAPVLRDVSFRVPAGASVGIAGPTGAGKTTLLSLMTRFYDPTLGTRFCSTASMCVTCVLRDLRNQFAIVHQDAVLFSTSIADNILYARTGASQREIEDAARAANAHDFIIVARPGLRDGRRRTGHAAVRRRAAAHRAGARVSEGRADAAARRADQLGGHQDRSGDHGGARTG